MSPSIPWRGYADFYTDDNLLGDPDYAKCECGVWNHVDDDNPDHTEECSHFEEWLNDEVGDE